MIIHQLSKTSNPTVGWPSKKYWPTAQIDDWPSDSGLSAVGVVSYRIKDANHKVYPWILVIDSFKCTYHAHGIKHCQAWCLRSTVQGTIDDSQYTGNLDGNKTPWYSQHLQTRQNMILPSCLLKNHGLLMAWVSIIVMSKPGGSYGSPCGVLMEQIRVDELVLLRVLADEQQPYYLDRFIWWAGSFTLVVSGQKMTNNSGGWTKTMSTMLLPVYNCVAC